MAEDSPEPALALLERIWALDHALQMVSKRMRTDIGVTAPQRFVLRLVGQNPDMTHGEIARRMHDHPSTLTGVIQRLESQRLVIRVADAQDQRRVRLRLTKAGRQVNEVRSGTAEAAIDATLARLSDGEVDAFARGLDVLREELEKLVPAVELPVEEGEARPRRRRREGSAV